MIASSKSVKVLAVSVAALLHGAALWGLSVQPRIEIEGATTASEVSLGTSFADMAAGTLTSQVDPDITPRTQPSEAEPVEDVERAETPRVIKPVLAETPETAQPTKFAARVEPTQPTPLTTTEIAQRSDTIMPDVSLEAIPSVEPAETADVETTTVARSLRPRPRSGSFEKKHAAKPARKTAEKKAQKKTARKKPKTQAKAQPQGNAKRNAKAGSATDHSEAKTKSNSSGASKKKSANGNAAASSYPGKVMRKIARVPKPRVGKKGAAVVAFTISANGGLATISLARSSGSGQLDKAALRVVRQAAPFPPPPSGARRSFSIKIKGG